MDTIVEADLTEADRPQRTVVADLMARADRILPAIAAGAADRERHRELPHNQIRHLARAQLLTFRIPRAHAGPGASVAQTFQFIIDLAAADSNIAQACRPGFAFIEGLLAGGEPQECDRWFPRALAGAVFGNAGWEIGGANGEVRTRITRDGDRYTVNGSKFYSTGALYADWIGTTAVDDDGEPVSFVVPRDREGLELLDDFDAMGQRLTASGTTNLTDVTVYPQEIRRRPQRDRRSPVTAFLQLYLGAVLAGIARNAMTDAVLYARHHARPIKHSSASRSTEDPYVQHAVGEISAHAYAAEAAILRAAGAIDRAWAAQLPGNLLTAAAVEVAQAQFVATNAALRAAELAFDVGGGSATARVHNLDRHWRNARTVANHNPRAWKAAAVGAYRLTGAEPPTSGLF
jgi:alkylation response protein AidB-like acyl-CoA dehydrogenase